MNQNWIVENLNNAFSTWNGKLTELWGLVTTSPQTFKGGAVWGVMQSLHNAMIGIAPFILLRTYILYSDILVSRAFSIVCSFSYSYSLAIQYNGKLNLTSTRFVFFIHAKSSLYNRLLDIAKTAFQKQLTSKSTVF